RRHLAVSCFCPSLLAVGSVNPVIFDAAARRDGNTPRLDEPRQGAGRADYAGDTLQKKPMQQRVWIVLQDYRVDLLPHVDRAFGSLVVSDLAFQVREPGR